MISIQNFCYAWKGQDPILRYINLEIPKGQFVLISGRSGSGKSTLGSAINGLIPHYYEGNSSGIVYLDGKDTRELPLYEIGKIVGTVFQDPRSQFFTSSTDEEIAFGIEQSVSSREELKNRVDQVYQDLNLGHLRHRSVFELSSGEKQKIAIASIYAMRAPVLVLDEPSANLDMKASEELYQMLVKLKAWGTTIVLIEHRLSYLHQIFDRFLLMEDGRLQADMTTGELRNCSPSFFEKHGLRSLELGMCHVSPKTNQERSEDKLLLLAKDIGFSYKNRANKQRVTVLEGLGVSVQRGRAYGLIGKNGVGKTTLARILTGLTSPQKGRIETSKGQSLNDSERLKLSYFVFQDSDYQLFSESVLDEVMLGISSRHEAEVEEKALQILRSLGLEVHVDRHPFALSRGEKQRLTIACGLMKEAELYVYDEPTSGSDRDTMLAVSKMIRTQIKHGLSALLISHDYEFLLSIADEIWLLEEGRIRERISVQMENERKILQAMMGGEWFE